MFSPKDDTVQTSKKPTYKIIDGFPISRVFSDEAFKSAVAYKPRSDDLFIVTYPKCGTTWLQNLVACIFREGKPFNSGLEFFLQSPFLELVGAEGVEKMKRPGSIKIHFPFHMAPWSPEAKYIFIARNPKDCCVSFYHHTKSGLAYLFSEGSFDDFFELFIKGEVGFGDYFETTLSWWEHRDDPNVLFITYEDLKKDTANIVLKIAGFIGSEYKEKLEKNEQMLEKVIHNSSFSFMNKHLNEGIEEVLTMPKEDIQNNPDIPQGLKSLLLFKQPGLEEVGDRPPKLVRKGVTGDWRNYFSSSQSTRMDETFRNRFAGTGLLNLWKDYM